MNTVLLGRSFLGILLWWINVELPHHAHGALIRKAQVEQDALMPYLNDFYADNVGDFCVYNKKYYKVGEAVHEDDPCQSCVCQSGGGIICNRPSCPHVHSFCQKTYTPDGTCCKACACYHDGVSYREGDSWPVFEGSNCFECQCKNGMSVCHLPVCSTCHDDVTATGQCCRACTTALPVTMVIKETTAPPVMTLPMPPNDAEKKSYETKCTGLFCDNDV